MGCRGCRGNGGTGLAGSAQEAPNSQAGTGENNLCAQRNDGGKDRGLSEGQRVLLRRGGGLTSGGGSRGPETARAQEIPRRTNQQGVCQEESAVAAEGRIGGTGRTHIRLSESRDNI